MFGCSPRYSIHNHATVLTHRGAFVSLLLIVYD
jgi:hypothetical protein